MDYSFDRRILPVGGGKGGVGKSIITAGIGSIMARQGRSVVFFDGDLGGANLHLLLGVKYPAASLQNFLESKEMALEQILLDTAIPGTKLVSGASDVLGLANPKFAQKEKIFRSIKKLAAQHILIDLGAGTNYNTIDFFTLSNKGIIVIDAELTSIENAYGFLKTSILRKIQRFYASEAVVGEIIDRASSTKDAKKISSISDLFKELEVKTPDKGAWAQTWITSFKPRLVVNRVKAREDVEVAKRFCGIARKYLNVEPVFLGYVVEDQAVQASVNQTVPLAMAQPDCQAMQCLETITKNLLALEEAEAQP